MAIEILNFRVINKSKEGSENIDLDLLLKISNNKTYKQPFMVTKELFEDQKCFIDTIGELLKELINKIQEGK